MTDSIICCDMAVSFAVIQPVPFGVILLVSFGVI